MEVLNVAAVGRPPTFCRRSLEFPSWWGRRCARDAGAAAAGAGGGGGGGRHCSAPRRARRPRRGGPPRRGEGAPRPARQSGPRLRGPQDGTIPHWAPPRPWPPLAALGPGAASTQQPCRYSAALQSCCRELPAPTPQLGLAFSSNGLRLWISFRAGSVTWLGMTGVQYNEAREAAAAAYRKSVSGLKDGPSRQERMAHRHAQASQPPPRSGAHLPSRPPSPGRNAPPC